MSLRNDMSKHRFFVQKLVGTEHDNIKAYLEELRRAATRAFSDGTRGPALRKKLRKVMADLPTTTLSNMLDIAEYEAKFTLRTFKKFIDGELSAPSLPNIKKALVGENMSVNNVSFKNGIAVGNNEEAARRSLIAAYKQYGQRKADEAVQVILDARVKGVTATEAVNNINELINGRQTAQARVLADTAINYSTNIAKDQVIRENRDIIAQEVWVTDIELNSCEECLGYQAEGAQPVGYFPTPAVHWGCQCEVIPYVE